MDFRRRRESFGSVAAEYERARPGYPEEAVAWLAERLRIAPGCDVIDLGAGTGKLTRQLVPLGARVLALEPLDEMRAQLERVVPEAAAIAGAAEAIPLPDGSVDAITCGSAFHWFEAETALREMHRVLRPAGRVGLVWNTRDERDPLQRKISALIRDELFDDREGARDVVVRSRLFTDGGHAVYGHEQWFSVEELVDRIASTSLVAALPADGRVQMLDRVRTLARGLEEPIRFAYVTEVFAFQRAE